MAAVSAAILADARDRGWEGLLADQRAVLDGFWETALVDVEGDPELEQALRFNLFQLLQASATIDDAPIGAKGLTDRAIRATPSGTSRDSCCPR